MSYRSAWRRFRWRHRGYSDWLTTIRCLVNYLAIALCWLEWLHPGSIAPILVRISSAVWLANMVILLLAHPFVWWMNRVVVAAGPLSPATFQMMKWFGGIPALFSMGFQIGTLWMFLLRHLDGALVCASLWNIFFLLKKGWDWKEGRAILRASAEALLILAVIFHSGGLAVAWAVVTPFAYFFLRPSLTTFVRNKFSRAEAAQEIRRYIDTQSWPNLKDKVYGGLWWFCTYEFWKEARQWLESYKDNEVLSPVFLEYCQTMIAIGQGQYELASELERLLPQVEEMEQMDFVCRLVAIAYARLGKREDALRVINNRAELRRHDRSRCLADVHRTFGEWEMALRYYEAADTSAERWYGMATCLARLGYQREARELYRQAIILDRYVRLDYLQDLAVCCRRIGNDRMASEVERLMFEKGG